MPALKSTPVRLQVFHQSHATFPGLIQDVSAMRHSGARRCIMSLLASCVSWVTTCTPRIGLFPCGTPVGAEVGGIVGLADNVGTFGRDEVQAVIASDDCFQWIGGEFCLHSVGHLWVGSEEHAGIVGQSGFHNDGFLSVLQFYHQRSNGKRVFVHAREGGLIVVGLEGVAVTLAGAIVVNIGHESVVIAVEVELGNLVLHAVRKQNDRRLRRRRRGTVCYSRYGISA